MTKYIRALVNYKTLSLGTVYLAEPRICNNGYKVRVSNNTFNCLNPNEYEFVTEEVARKERPELFYHQVEGDIKDQSATITTTNSDDWHMIAETNQSALNDNLPSDYEPPKPEPKQPLSYLNNDKEREGKDELWKRIFRKDFKY